MSRVGGPILGAVLLAAFVGCSPRSGDDRVSAVERENRRTGHPDWQLSNPASEHEIEGYASHTSAAPGESVFLHVNTTSRWLDTQIYRLGWYRGAGARLIFQMRRTAGGVRTIPPPRPEDGLVACDWPASVRFRVGTDWPSGVYLARLRALEGGKEAFVPFVVRSGPGRAARYLMVLNTASWQAYNAWGGKSLYDFNSAGGARAVRVSYDRPYASGPGAWVGLGAGELLTTPHTERKAGWEYPMIRWLERRGIDVAYVADTDLHADPASLAGARGVLLVGHPEYWSRLMRDRLEEARAAGVGLALFGANAGYWQVRMEPSASGAPDRVLFCAKDHTRDSLFDTRDDRDLTVRFRDLHPRRPEVALFGVMTARGEESVEADYVPTPEARGTWAFRGTSIETGGATSIPGLVGYEVDRSFPEDSLYASWSPPGLQILARSPIHLRDGTVDRSESVTYETASGARVFAAGTVQWSWGLDDWGAPALRPGRLSADAERITLNVIEALDGGGAPGPSAQSPR